MLANMFRSIREYSFTYELLELRCLAAMLGWCHHRLHLVLDRGRVSREGLWSMLYEFMETFTTRVTSESTMSVIYKESSVNLKSDSKMMKNPSKDTPAKKSYQNSNREESSGKSGSDGGKQFVSVTSWPPLIIPCTHTAICRTILGSSWRYIGAFGGPSRASVGPFWAVLEPSWGPLGPSWRLLGLSWGPPWQFWGLLGSLLGRVGGSLGPSWAVLERQ